MRTTCAESSGCDLRMQILRFYPGLWGWSCPNFLQAASRPPSIHVSFWGPHWGGPVAGSSARTIASSALTTQRTVLRLGLPSSLSAWAEPASLGSPQHPPEGKDSSLLPPDPSLCSSPEMGPHQTTKG